MSLIITVDNGIQGHKEIEMVQKLGVDVIVTDHHEIGHTLPEAYAIVHPMHPEYEYPFHFLWCWCSLQTVSSFIRQSS